jgi:hypothetical protein
VFLDLDAKMECCRKSRAPAVHPNVKVVNLNAPFNKYTAPMRR